MSHIHTEPGQYDHTISLYIFRADFSEPKIMLHMHSKIGLYAQFGGHIELHENPWQTAIRELKEETGYDIDQVQLLQPLQSMKRIAGAILHPYPVAHNTMQYPKVKNGHSHTNSVYALLTSEEPRGMPGEGESTNIQLFTRAEIVSLGTEKIDRVTYDIALYIFDEILTRWKPVSPAEFK
jgi:8-oxo-dGTP pyrophosphatase MutT (NUDIX family)